MNYRHLVTSLVASSFGLVIACSGGAEGANPGGSGPDGSTSQMCTSFDECPSVPCSCSHGIVNARRCIDGYCLDRAHTCASTCGEDSPSPGTPGGPGTPSKPAPGDPCVPVSVSSIAARVSGVAARIAAHQVVPSTPANGDVDVTKNGDGKITHLSYNAPGSAEDYTESFTYDAGGRLTYFSHNGDGSTSDYTESFTYDADGLVTYLSHNADGSANDFTESFTYDASGHLTYWSYNGDGSESDVTESFTYDASGLVTYFSHNGDGSESDVTESFTYDGSGRLTYWSYNGDGSDDATISVTYSSSGHSLTTKGVRASGAVITSCK